LKGRDVYSEGEPLRKKEEHLQKTLRRSRRKGNVRGNARAAFSSRKKEQGGRKESPLGEGGGHLLEGEGTGLVRLRSKILEKRTLRGSKPSIGTLKENGCNVRRIEVRLLQEEFSGVEKGDKKKKERKKKKNKNLYELTE